MHVGQFHRTGVGCPCFLGKLGSLYHWDTWIFSRKWIPWSPIFYPLAVWQYTTLHRCLSSKICRYWRRDCVGGQQGDSSGWHWSPSGSEPRQWFSPWLYIFIPRGVFTNLDAQIYLWKFWLDILGGCWHGVSYSLLGGSDLPQCSTMRACSFITCWSPDTCLFLLVLTLPLLIPLPGALPSFSASWAPIHPLWPDSSVTFLNVSRQHGARQTWFLPHLCSRNTFETFLITVHTENYRLFLYEFVYLKVRTSSLSPFSPWHLVESAPGAG